MIRRFLFPAFPYYVTRYPRRLRYRGHSRLEGGLARPHPRLPAASVSVTKWSRLTEQGKGNLIDRTMFPVWRKYIRIEESFLAPVWAVTKEKVDAVVENIRQNDHLKKIILFGSYVRGESGQNSDLDILVITDDQVKNTREESVRIRRSLKDIVMPMDIIVIQESRFISLQDQPGLIFREAVRNGKIVYESNG